MKKVLTVLILLCVVSSIAFAGLFTSVSGFTLQEVEPDSVYALDTIGENPRVYEFTTKTEPKRKCVVIFTESKQKSPVLQCWSVSSEKKK